VRYDKPSSWPLRAPIRLGEHGLPRVLAAGLVAHGNHRLLGAHRIVFALLYCVVVIHQLPPKVSATAAALEGSRALAAGDGAGLARVEVRQREQVGVQHRGAAPRE
jgi:hypothetical protein